MTNNLRGKIKALMTKFSLSSMVEQLTLVQAIDSNDEQIQANTASITALEPKVNALPTYVYKATLTQSGANAPTAVVLVNTFPDEDYTYDSTGTYILDLGVDLGSYNVNHIQEACISTGLPNGEVAYIFGTPSDTYEILTTTDTLSLTDGVLTNYTITIEAYAQ
jgi:hypothetical protein